MSRHFHTDFISECDECIHCMTPAAESPVFCKENQDDMHPHVWCSVKKSFSHPLMCEQFMGKIDRQRQLLNKKLTHRGIVLACIDYAKSRGWDAAKASDYKGMPASTGGVPDIILNPHNNFDTKVSLEIKPPNCTVDEIRRGIGQCAYHLLFGTIPYLVCSEAYEKELLIIFRRLLVLSLIVYDTNCELKVVFGKPL